MRVLMTTFYEVINIKKSFNVNHLKDIIVTNIQLIVVTIILIRVLGN